MSKKTETEWQTLDKRIAELVMGWNKSSPSEDAVWLTSNNQFSGYYVEEPAHPEYGEQCWQPQNNVPQALLAADALVDKNSDLAGYTLTYSPSKRLYFHYRCTFSSLRVLPRDSDWAKYKHGGSGTTQAKTICQAIKECMNILRLEK